MVWDGKDKRGSKPGRRDYDNGVCPFHHIQCDAIRKNEGDLETQRDKVEGRINHIEEIMVTKEDLRQTNQEVKSKAPWAVVALFISTIVVVGVGVIGVGWHFMNETHKELSEVHTNTEVLSANQVTFMKAFGLKGTTKEEIEQSKNE